MTTFGSTTTDDPPFPDVGSPWAGIPDRLRARGLRWTPQRRVLVEVLSQTDGHVTGAELIERCRSIDPETIPSTVYRTLDVLEEIGVLSHSHGADGREEFHVLPAAEHGHLYCRRCGAQWELATTDPSVSTTLEAFENDRGFEIDVSHVTLIGRCRSCRIADAEAGSGPRVQTETPSGAQAVPSAATETD